MEEAKKSLGRWIWDWQALQAMKIGTQRGRKKKKGEKKGGGKTWFKCPYV